jgi:hypothetical protein
MLVSDFCSSNAIASGEPDLRIWAGGVARPNLATKDADRWTTGLTPNLMAA